MAAIRSDQAKAHRGAVRTRVTAVADRAAYAAGPAGSPGSRAVVVAGLCKSYGAVRAVRGVSFAVGRGEVFALLGPNGAGKTTTLEILEGFRARDAGQVEVLGLDPGDRSHGRALRAPGCLADRPRPAR